MSEMIDAVAKAIYESRNGAGCIPWSRRPAAHKDPYMEDARAAVEAMREPTEAMLTAGYQALLDWPEVWPKAPNGGHYTSEYVEAMLAWPAMIDAALSQSPNSLPTPAATPTDSANPPPVESVGPNSTNGWQLIDTAPTDGTFVFLYWPTMSITSFPQVGFHHGDEYGWELVNDRDYGEVFPTHWRELFSPPNSKASVGPNSEAQS